MYKNILVVGVVLLLAFTMPLEVMAGSRDSSDLLRQGLLGAGAGAVGGAASGAKGRDVWKGALAGAGVNIIGGKVDNTQRVDSTAPRDAYSQGYQEGYQNGYKAGYTEGYKEGLKESYRGN